MGEAVDACRREIFGVLVVEDVGDDVEPLLVRRFDDCPVVGRRELLDRTTAVVHPDLDEGDTLPGQLGNQRASLILTRYTRRRWPERGGARARHRRGEAASRREETRTTGLARRLVALNLAPQFAGVRPHRDDDADAVIGVALQVIFDVGARVVGGVVGQAALKTDVAMQVDQRRDEGLAGKVDDACPVRRRHGVCRTGVQDDALVHHQCARFNRGSAITGNQAGAAIDNGSRAGLVAGGCGFRPAAASRGEQQAGQQQWVRSEVRFHVASGSRSWE